jgi:hypothetical protein
MLPNIDQALYLRFKREGYRKKEYRRAPVPSVEEVVQLGYLDVNRTLGGIEPAQSWWLKQAVVTFIKDLVSSPPENQHSFDLLHEQCCNKCVKAEALGKARIYHGQAQKLLNMSLKYLYNEFAAYCGEVNYFTFPDNNVEHFFHLPIDSQVRNRLVEICHFVNPTSLPWSKWEYSHYMSFQDEVRKRINSEFRPLEIDYILWNTNGASLRDAMM